METSLANMEDESPVMQEASTLPAVVSSTFTSTLVSAPVSPKAKEVLPEKIRAVVVLVRSFNPVSRGYEWVTVPDEPVVVEGGSARAVDDHHHINEQENNSLLVGGIHPTAPYASRVLGSGWNLHSTREDIVNYPHGNRQAPNFMSFSQRPSIARDQNREMYGRLSENIGEARNGSKEQSDERGGVGSVARPSQTPSAGRARGPTVDTLDLSHRSPFGNRACRQAGRSDPASNGVSDRAEEDLEGESSSYLGQLNHTNSAVNGGYTSLRGISPDALTKVVHQFSGAAGDWTSWSDKFKTFMNFYGMKQYLVNVEHAPLNEWDENLVNDLVTNQFLYDCLLLVLDPATVMLIKSEFCAGHGMAAWHTLCVRYRGSLDLRVANLLDALQRNRWYSDREHLSYYFARTRVMVQELAMHNHPISPTMHSIFLLKGLPTDPEFRQFSAINRVQENQTPEATEERLRRYLLKSEKYRPAAGDTRICTMEECYAESDEEEEIQIAREIARTARASGSCFVCGESGHIARQCPKRAGAVSKIGRGSPVVDVVRHEIQLATEMASEAIRKGLCFVCNQPGHRAFVCPIRSKRQREASVRLVDTVEPEENNEISLIEASGDANGQSVAPSDDWKLNPEIFRQLDEQWGPHHLDVFASKWSKQVPRHFDRECDAFQQEWEGGRLWINPPWRLVPEVLSHIEKHVRVPFTFVAPLEECAPFLGKLRSWSITDPKEVEHTNSTFVRTGYKGRTGLPKWTKTLAWNCLVPRDSVEVCTQVMCDAMVTPSNVHGPCVALPNTPVSTSSASMSTDKLVVGMRMTEPASNTSAVTNALALLRLASPLVLDNQTEATIEYVRATGATSANEWKVDSGASTHATADENLIVDGRPVHVDIKTAAGGEALHASVRGNVLLKAHTKFTGWVDLQLGGVLGVKGLRGNILSASKLIASGVMVNFERMQLVTSRGSIPMYWKKGIPCVRLVSSTREGAEKQIVLPSNEVPWDFLPDAIKPGDFSRRHIQLAVASLPTGDPTEGLKNRVLPEVSDDDVVSEDDKALKVLSPDEIMRVHRCCAHVSLGKLRQALGRAIPKDFTRLDCVDCAIGKATALPVNDSGDHPTKAPLEVVVTDIMGPRPADLKGRKYMFGFTDKHTGFKIHFAASSKKDYDVYLVKALRAFGHFDAIRGGGEIATRKLEEICAQRGIEVQRAVPYHHTDLGPAERGWRTIGDLERTMRQWAGAPAQLWTYSWKHAVDVSNRMPRKGNVNNLSPYEAIADRKMALLKDVIKLPIWGCLCFVHIPVELQRNKLDPRAWTGVYLGTARHRKGYKVFLHGSRKIVISRDVTFSDQPGWTDDLFKRAEIDLHWQQESDDDEGDGATDEPVEHDTPSDSDLPRDHPPSVMSDNAGDKSAGDDGFSSLPAVSPDRNSTSDAEGQGETPFASGYCVNLDANYGIVSPLIDYGEKKTLQRTRRIKASLHVDSPTSDHGGPIGHDASAVNVNVANILPQVSIPEGAPRRSARLRGQTRIDYDEGEDLKTAGILELLAKSGVGDDPQVYSHLYEHVDETMLTFNQVMNLPDHHLWRAAIVKELRELRNLKTWELAQLPSGRRTIKHKWVFRRKLNADGSVERYKARLVARGYSEQPGVDYFETFAAVIRPESVRLLIALSKLRNLNLFQVDIGNAFLNATLDEEIYLDIPRGFALDHDSTEACTSTAGSVLRLLRGLPGLKQSCRNWYRRIRQWLAHKGYEPSLNDPCIFCHVTKNMIVGVYVDDFIIAAESATDYDELVKDLSKEFRVSAMGPLKWFLGVEVERLVSGGFSLSQELYIKKMCADYKITLVGREHTPMVADFVSSGAAGEGTPVDSTDYRSRIGSLLHLVKWTRPDIAYAVGFLARFSSDPKQGALQGVNKVLRYVLSTANQKLILDPELHAPILRLASFSDSDFAFNPIDRKSITGWVVFLLGAPINWASKRQDVVATSTLEAEFIALFGSSQECLFLHRLLQDMVKGRFELSVPLLYCDNMGALALANDPCAHKRSKHIDVKFRAIQDRVEQKSLSTAYVRTQDNLADLLTKPVARNRLNDLGAGLRGSDGSQHPSAIPVQYEAATPELKTAKATHSG